MCATVVLDVNKIVCTFEENTACSFEDDLHLKERWTVVESTVTNWDNTLNVGEYVSLRRTSVRLYTLLR